MEVNHSWGLPGLKRSHFRSTKGKKINRKNCVSVVIDFRALKSTLIITHHNRPWLPKCCQGLHDCSQCSEWQCRRDALQSVPSASDKHHVHTGNADTSGQSISPFDPSLLCILSYYRYFPCLSILCHIPSSTATILSFIKLWRKGKSLFSKCHRGKRS